MVDLYTKKRNKGNEKYSLVPDVTGYFVKDGIKILEENGFESKVLASNGREDSIIIIHEPMGGDYVKKASIIEIVAE